MQALHWAPLAAASFAAGLVQAASGFGFAVLAAPLFLIVLPPGTAIPLVIILTAALSLSVLPRVRGAVAPGLLARLTLGSLFGVPLGLFAFRHADPLLVRMLVGAAILVFAGVFGVVRRRPARHSMIALWPGFDVIAGAVSGAATALIGMSGPPVVIYLLLAGAAPQMARATLLAFFSLCYVATIAALAASTGIAAPTWIAAALLIPFTVLGGVLGKRLGDRLRPGAFALLAIALLAGTGVYTLATTLASVLSQDTGHSAAER
ncbi:MAG: sulfite exporter TauE/SafE family protein [Stellaceae bacterium]